MTGFTPSCQCESCLEHHRQASHSSQPDAYAYMCLQLLHVQYSLFCNVLAIIETHVCASAGQHCQAAEEHTGR